MINKLKKALHILLGSAFALLALLIFLNLTDSPLSSEAAQVLNHSLESNNSDEKKCAAFLGLLVDPKLDSIDEGFKFLEKIKAIPIEAFSHSQELVLPRTIERIDGRIKCQGTCTYNTDEVKILKDGLAKQTVYLKRFKELIEMGDVQCHSPQVLVKQGLLSFFALANHQIIEYKIMNQDGLKKEARAGLMKMNTFLENTLLRDKYTIINASIHLALLNRVRETLLTITDRNEPLLFKDLKYDELVQRIVVGELQVADALAKGPLDYPFFELADINALKSSSKSFEILIYAVNKIFNFFYLPQESTNDRLRLLQSAAWHPCIGQKDIACETKSPLFFTWIRNPTGKAVNKLIASNMGEYFRKIKGKLNNLEGLPSSTKKINI